jgi:hypothetical protein
MQKLRFLLQGSVETGVAEDFDKARREAGVGCGNVLRQVVIGCKMHSYNVGMKHIS